jgi:hypothetical protein
MIKFNKMVYQEIEENSGNVKGTIVPKGYYGYRNEVTTVSWTNLLGLLSND